MFYLPTFKLQLLMLVLATLLTGCQTAILRPTAPDLSAPPVGLTLESTPPTLLQTGDVSSTAAALAHPAETASVVDHRFLEPLTLRPSERNPPARTTDLWMRLRQGFQWPQVDASASGVLQERIAKHLRWYQANPAHVQRTFERSRLYLYDITQALQREGLPLEIALLPAIESAYQTGVCSHAAACGLWQFISPTARRFDLKQHLFADDRRHLTAATTAALRYLKELHQRFGGDWQLALAAYNCGEGCIERAVRVAKARGLPGRFEDLRLVDETAQYVPRLLALAQVVANPARYGLALPPLQNAPYFAAVPITRDIDVALAAKLAHMPLGDFLALNPQHKKPVIVAATNPEIYLPAQLAEAFASALLQHRGQMSNWATVTVQHATRLETLAQQHGVSAQALGQTNAVQPKWVIASGSTLLVPRTPTSGLQDITVAIAERGVLAAQAPPHSAKAKFTGKKARPATPVTAKILLRSTKKR